MITKRLVLVTGAAGYLGQLASTALRSAGYDVLPIDNFSTSPEQPDITYADCRDSQALDLLFENYDVDAVIHFAGLKDAAESVDIPDEYYDNNVTGTNVLVNSMCKAGVRNLVFSSSAAVYGEPTELPITEDATTSPENPYGMSKLMAETQILRACAKTSTFTGAILRYFNPLGGPTPPGSSLMAQILTGELTIYGDGYAKRDFIHVDDLIEAHLKALDWCFTSVGCGVWNIGTGRPHMVIEVLEKFEEITGIRLTVKMKGKRKGDVRESWADPTNAWIDLGWEARYGLADMIRNVKENNIGKDT